ncbi:MAG: methyl-accepting chemotaxis protein [Thiomicrorhabdus sp.]|nr:methyl-accepting chemotaxis protein [Thiomicrorhabdus sp.]
MNAFLQKLSIQQKIRFGFGIIWLVLAVITIQAVVNLAMVRSDIAEIVEEKQPFAIETAKTAFLLEKSLNALNRYVLTQEESQLEVYRSELLGVQTVLKNTLDMNGLEEGHLVSSQYLFGLLEKLPPVITQLEEAVESPHIQFPALAYADQYLKPLSTELQTLFSEEISSLLTSLNSTSALLLEDILAFQVAWLQVHSDVYAYLALKSDSSVEKIEQEFNQIEALQAQIATRHATLLNSDNRAWLVKMDSLYQSYREHYMLLKGKHESDQWRTDTWLMSQYIVPIFHELDEALITLSNQAVEEMTRESESALNSSLYNIIILLLLSGFGQLMGMWVSKRITTSVVEPIQAVSSLMKAFATGKGDLTRRLPTQNNEGSQDEMNALAGYFNQFIAKIQSMLQEVTQTIQELEASSGQLLKITHEAKAGSQQQLQATHVLSDSMTNMTEQSKRVENHSHNAARATEQAADRVKEGGDKVLGTVEVIQTLSGGMDNMTQAVEQLRHESDAIGMVVSVIRDIAEQTNLLSLNAAIEAARAGEHGRGFAVVADEVRGLAKRTQDSTKQIEQMIDNIHRATLSTVNMVEQGREATESSCQAIEETKHALQPVTILMDDIHQMSEQMASAAQAQTSLAQEMNNNIHQIHSVTEKSVQGAENTEKAGHDLQNLANKLDQLVHQFKI